MNKVTISKRKFESYKRAEIVARELRFQLSGATRFDGNLLCDMVMNWMNITGKIKYERPKHKKRF